MAIIDENSNAFIDEISNAFYDYSVKYYEEELKNSEKPSEKSFPAKSTFQEDFQTNINAVYNEINRSYPPEQANYVYKTLLANLNKQSQNPGQSKIVDLSKGKINVQNLKAYSKKVQETLKTRHPERFEVKATTVVDIEKRTNFSDLQTLEDKKNWFNQNVGDISSWNENEQNALMGICTILDEKKSAKAQYMNDGHTEPEAEELAKRDVSQKHNIDNESISYLEEDFGEDLEKLSLAETEKDKEEILHSLKSKIEEKYANLDFSNKNIDEIIKTLGDKDKKINESANDEYVGTKIEVNEDSLELFDELNMEEDIFGLKEDIVEHSEEKNKIDKTLPNIENELEEESLDLENLFGENEEIQTEVELSQNIENTYINSIMAGVQISQEELETETYEQEIPENPLQKFIAKIKNRFFNKQQLLDEGKQEDYTQDIKENIFSRIKNTISKLMHKNNPLAINTSENNTPSVENSNITASNPWELSQYGTTQEEILANTQNAINNSNKNKSTKNSSIEITSGKDLNI